MSPSDGKDISARSLLAAAALGLLALSGAAEARTNRALLIAVTDYPKLPPRAALVGPNHDAALVRSYLLDAAPEAFEPENLTVLADGLEGAAGSPTHARILGAMKRLAEASGPGDFVYIHYSGHGTQQPALDPKSETDGKDEILLPSDTGNWVDRAKGVPDALVDNEIGLGLDAIRAKGAFVWMVFDACQSGTATREAPVDGEEITERRMDPGLLGIPQSAFAQAEAEAGAAEGASRGLEETREAPFSLPGAGAAPTGAKLPPKGGMVAFFAAQTVETTPEMKLPKGAPDARKYGLFTYTIFSEIAANPAMTYRQLGAAVLQHYAADARSRPTPLFEGDLDARVWGTERIETAQQWPLDVKGREMSVPAGLLQRLGPGTKLAVLPSPASEPSEALGYVEVKTAKNLSARVSPVAWNGKPALRADGLPAKPYARVAELAVDFRLAVARPASGAGLEKAGRAVDAALAAVEGQADKGFNVRFAAPGAADADIRLAVLPESRVREGGSEAPVLAFLPSTGEVDKASRAVPPLVTLEGKDAAALTEAVSANLRKIFRAVALSRLAAASDYRPEEVSLSFLVKPEGSDAMLPLDGASVPIVHPGDEVHFRAENMSGTNNVDLNILYIGSDWSVTHILAERLVPGALVEEGLLAFTDSSFGPERMIAVLTEAPPQSELEDLSFLAQDGAPASRAATEKRGFSAMLDDIGAAPPTRSVMRLGDKGGSKGAVMIFPLETAPRR